MSSLDLPLHNPLPSWLPDESLFSLLSRFHTLSGNRLASTSCQALFGAAQRGCAHDFPTNLHALDSRVNGALGDPAKLAYERTLLRFYLPLQTAEQFAEAVASLCGAASGMLKFRLGILTSRFRANHPLKACLDCVRTDETMWGTSYWHLAHQFPGVWRCSSHGTLLLESSLKSTGVARFGWALPHAATLLPAGAEVDPATMSALARLADLVVEWSDRPMGSRFASEHLAMAYRVRLLAVFGDAALRARQRGALGESFCSAVAPLRAIPELRALPASRRDAAAQIERWILAPRGGTHPLRHLAIIFWLFEDWQQFLAVYAKAADGASLVADREDDVCRLQDPRRAELFASMARGESVSAVARTLGITTNTAMAWATQQGLTVRHRPKSLVPAVRSAVIDLLRLGADRASVAQRCGVSAQAVTRVLQTEHGLREVWNASKNELRRQEARRAWCEAMQKFEGLPLTLVRHQASSAYAWLYRNDRSWLGMHRPTAIADVGVKRPGVDWDARDVALSADVRRVAAELAAAHGSSRLDLWQLYQRLPELKAKLGALRRLPLTLKAIQETTRRRRKPGQIGLL